MRLTAEQIQAAEFDGNGAYAIKGVAGSGKTSIGLHRISYLLENKCPENDDKVLMLTFNRSLIKYLEYQYKKITVTVPKQLIIGEASKRDAAGTVEINTVNEKSYICFERFFENEESRPNVLWRGTEGKEIRKELFLQAISTISQEFHAVNILNESNINYLEDEINWMKASMLLNEKDYLEADRMIFGRDEQELKRLPKNSEARKAIFALHITYQDLLKNRNHCEFIDTEIAALNYTRKYDIQRYTHIIIDESQDMSRLQLEFIKSLLNRRSYSTITFLYDTTQSIYPNSWLGMGRSFASAGINIQGKTKVLRKNFRTSNEILCAARNMISAEEILADSEPFYCNQTGIRPVLVHCNDNEEHNKEIVQLVQNLQERFGLSDIAITSRYNKHLQNIKEILDRNGIQAEVVNRTTESYGNESVKLITFHSFKGIESKAVIVAGLTAEEFPYRPSNSKISKKISIEERRLLYVAMTRASKMLFLFTHGKPSSYVTDIAPELVKQIQPGSRSEGYFTEQEEASYSNDLDPKRFVTDLENDNRERWDQDERIEKLDRKLYPDSKVISKIVEFLKEHHVIEEDESEKSSEDIVEGLLIEYTRKKEENSALHKKVNNLLTNNKKLLIEKQQVPDYNRLKLDFMSKFPDFEDNLIEMLVNTEFTMLSLPSKSTDFFAQYIAYGKVVELLLKKAIVEYGIEMNPYEKTLGKIFYKLVNEDQEWKSVLGPLEAIGFITKRNDATHTKRVKFAEISELRKVLFEKNLLFQIGKMVA